MRTPEQNREHVRNWREANRERYLQLKKESNARNYKADYQREYYAQNRERIKARNRAWYEKNKERRRESSRKRLYGLPQGWYEKQVTKQNGKCAICSTPGELFVDHCHKTNMVRGLLCHHCNIAIERLETHADWGNSAASYLALFRDFLHVY